MMRQSMGGKALQKHICINSKDVASMSCISQAAVPGFMSAARDVKLRPPYIFKKLSTDDQWVMCLAALASVRGGRHS